MSEYAVVNPATGETLATYDTLTDTELAAKVAAADAAYRAWRLAPVAERAAAIRRVAELHRERRDELSALIVREMGKPLAAAEGEVDFAADITEFYADNAGRITADQPIDILGEGTAVIRKAPIGVLLGIMPWNFPAYQVARFAAPNLVLGNTILLKHAPQCPESSAAIERIYHDAGVPVGGYTNLYITNDQAATVIADPRVQGVSVTGSERAGAAVAEIAGRNLKKVALELGGSDPFILLSTDDLDGAVSAAVEARLDNTGQSCNAAKRFIVVDGLYDAFVEKFTAAMTAATVGDPFAEDTVLGPLSSLAAAERLAAQVDHAVAQGATLVAGGTRDGAFYAPTVLTDVTSDMDVYREELFGPVGVVYRVAGEDEAVAIANDTSFGLGSYVFTTDPAQAERVADAIDAGMVYVNLVLADSPELPFGGVKRSGTSREMGLLAADEFVNKKLVRVAG
ncbi:MAG: succinate-semialdehyde dehydrogenase [Microbacterium sp.]|jgi:succinate-semialdehyde dehydrogenase/glutarate-semialdehyde dehydrogenase|uniref:NAD-dependent succinate-semialdehyde dehydrogenase n=1 Tax=Microbacterium ginsengisoli TaxID=400772 RepID=A0A0F0LVY8_9MICO|nr:MULTISPECIES: NAD-dependent succinate-semialdehyde dehydrogenase [Microbacterium]MAL06576.1 succinate-semialdehyde dehydrogenase [Microbacterium sp.]MCK9915450.1 NAD-dependent succinate-semialdehyde dehydrogenase [Microbacteriaceae bacterium K1510]KJL36849.1 Succinate-semialdehyde dehydrogenase [NADP(+)] 1 [Microbacterium ginsengisoli]MBN9208286.1 NAD-dependent succinate-semialdehyde dehydrogenase [Microbacterium ginsengisoli]ODU77291.1 MAG: succinate-semialdehyde dehydrogenase [Microbacter